MGAPLGWKSGCLMKQLFVTKRVGELMRICKAILAVLLFFTACQAGDATGRSYFQPRLPWSQHYLLQADAQRQVDKEEQSRLHWSAPGEPVEPRHVSGGRAGKSHFTLSSSVMYQSSTSDKNFARYFLPGGKNNLVVKGANFPAGDPLPDISATWLQIVGDNVGAPVLVAGTNLGDMFDNDLDNAQLWFNQYSSVISLKPQFESSSATINLRYNNKIGRIPWAVTFGVPFAQMRQRMGLSETAIEHQVAKREDVPVLVALENAGAGILLREFMQSQYSLTAAEALKNPNKRYGKISDGVLDASGLGDMSVDFSFDPCSFLTFGVRAELPTSKKATAEYLFEPLVGSNGHGKIAAYATLCKELCDWKDVVFAVRGHGQYQAQLPGNELRTFDLQQAGPWSRYLLLLDEQNDSHNAQSGVNFLTQPVRVDVLQNMTLGLAADAKYKAFSASLGYSLFMRGQEKLAMRRALPDRLFIAGQLAPLTPGGDFQPDLVYAGQKNISLGSPIKIAVDAQGEPSASPQLALTASDLDLQSASMPAYCSQQLMASIGFLGCVHKHQVQFNAGSNYEFVRYGSGYNVYSLFGSLTVKV